MMFDTEFLSQYIIVYSIFPETSDFSDEIKNLRLCVKSCSLIFLGYEDA